MKLRRPVDRKTRQLAQGIAYYLKESPTPPTKIEVLYGRIQQFAKYVGIPSLIIAAMMPAYNFTSGLVDYSNRAYVQKIQTRYAFDLLNQGEIDRANFILTKFPNTDKFDVATFYATAKVLLKRAINQGQEQDHAQDIAAVLISLYENRPLLFPKVGTSDEITDLRLDLVEVNIQRGNYIRANEELTKIDPKSLSDHVYVARSYMKRAEILVSQSLTTDARKILLASGPLLSTNGTKKDWAEYYFLLGKTYQFEHNNSEAIINYNRAKDLFSSAGDSGSTIKAYNNIGMAYTDNQDYDKARFYYELEATLSRQLNDNLSLGRALVNIALVDREQNKTSLSIEHGLEAKEAFSTQNNKIGMAASLQNLANTYTKSGDYAKGILYGKEAFLQFRELNDLRGVARSAGVLAEADEGLGNQEDAYYNVIVALLVNKEIGYEKTAGGQRDQTAQRLLNERVEGRLGSANAAEIKFRAQNDVKQIFDFVRLSISTK